MSTGSASVKDTESSWSKLRLEMAQLKATELPDGVRGPIVDSDFGDTVAVLIIAVHGGHYGYRRSPRTTPSASKRNFAAFVPSRSTPLLGEQKEVIEITQFPGTPVRNTPREPCKDHAGPAGAQFGTVSPARCLPNG